MERRSLDLKIIGTDIQEALGIPEKIDSTRKTPRNIVLKMTKSKDLIQNVESSKIK